MAKRVTAIPATLNRYSGVPINVLRKRRTAGYGRVSTDSLEQQTSYEAQLDYYTRYISSREDWEFVGMYADEGITATSTKCRKGFNDMVEDALAGKIDLIITKSISRFARNTVDSLVTVRKLKEKGVEIYFEKENIWTLDAKGELLITIMSSLAQEESRSISENTTWGKRKGFADGKASVAYKNFLGYDRGEDGEFVVNEEQAKVVKLIYKSFLEGLSPYKIAQMLTERGIPTPMGKGKWQQSTVASILTNEKYKGDALLQKQYVEDFLTKKRRRNRGEVQQYYVEGHHAPIISPDIFEQVQAEMLRRRNMRERYSGVGIFSSKIRCGECGSWYGSKVWHSTDKYRKVIYRCNHKFDGGKKCSTPHFTEDEIKDAFVKAFNRIFSDRAELLANVEVIIGVVSDTSELEAGAKETMDEMAVLVNMTQDIISRNARVAQSQEEYQERYNSLLEKYAAKKAEHDALQTKIEERRAKAEVLRQYAGCLARQQDTLAEFDEGLWCGLVDFITVYSREDVRVTFKDGSEIRV
ncbi:MAG: recombinase family protein [Muribaculaceae bacterium]|nr:recombinase family protein [Muribaculaceae bacterium]